MHGFLPPPNLLGVNVALPPQDDMRGFLRRYEFHTSVHLLSAGGLARTVERLAGATCDKVKRHAAVYLDRGGPGVVGQDEDWCSI